MRTIARIARLEARAPKQQKRIILVWIDSEGRRTKAADTHGHLQDTNTYDAYLSKYDSTGMLKKAPNYQ